MNSKSKPKALDEDKAFEGISFEDLVLHTLLDMFEFSVHSFNGVGGPYFWNGLGIDFESPMPKEEVLEHALSFGADTIYVAHTHPMSNDDSFKFAKAKVDPREQIAFGDKPLPLGNRPSSGDVSYLNKVKKEFASKNIKVIGAVFSAGGIWEFDIQDMARFNADKFASAYDGSFPITDDDFMTEWTTRIDYPSYYMEVQKPNMHTSTYRTQLSKIKSAPNGDAHTVEITKTIRLFHDNGVRLNFHPYTEFGIDPRQLMRDTIDKWTKTFVKR